MRDFEPHTPAYLRRKWVLNVYCDFRDYTTYDRRYGMLGLVAILNHVVKHANSGLTHLASDGTHASKMAVNWLTLNNPFRAFVPRPPVLPAP